MKKFAGFIVLVLMGSFLLAGCSSGGGGGDDGPPADSTGKIQLSGSIAAESGYSVKPTGFKALYAKVLSIVGLGSPAYAGAGDLEVDQVFAIPMDRGSLNSWGMQNSVVGTINNDGTFSLSLSKAHDWLLVLIDSRVTGTNRFVGSVGINTGSDSLLNLPGTDAAIAALDLGNLTKTTSSDAISSGTVTALDFSMTADELTAMAKSDDLFRNAMNIVNNYGAYGNAATEWYQLRPDFHWLGSYATLTTGFSDPGMMLKGVNFQLDTNTTGITMAEICSSTTATIVELVPPAAITDTAQNTFTPTNPITNYGAECQSLNDAQETKGGLDFYACDAYGENGQLSYGMPADFFSLPDGEWVWKEHHEIKAVFNVNTVNPPLTASKGPKGFVPSFKVNLVPGSTQIESVDVKWYYYDEAATEYVELADRSVLGHFINSLEIKFDVTTDAGRKTCEMYFDPVTTTNVKPSDFSEDNCAEPWYYNDSTPEHAATDTGLMGFYETGGFGYFFDFFKTLAPTTALQ